MGAICIAAFPAAGPVFADDEGIIRAGSSDRDGERKPTQMDIIRMDGGDIATVRPSGASE